MGWDNALWQTVVSVALVGTERQPFTRPTATGKLGQLLTQLADQSCEQPANQPPEASLLITAAVLSLYRQAGWISEKSASAFPSVAPCAADCTADNDLPRCGVRATACLQQILQGQYPQVLPEWLALAATAQQRIPERYLPELLDLGSQQRNLRAALLPVLGQRGRWLAMQNPDWSYAAELSSEEDWETGSTAARILSLLDLRAHDPEQARTLLQTTWSQEAASERTKFLETLHTGLSMADEPFLIGALNDRSKEVRRVAADLLSRLPESRLCQTVAAHTTGYISIETDPAKPDSTQQRLNVELPKDLDPALIQCGIESKSPRRANLGEKAWWLLQMLGATPLGVWQGDTPTNMIQLAKHHEWETVLLEGWVLAATRQQNVVWLEALLNRWIEKGMGARTVLLPDLGLDALLDGLPPNRQNAFLTHLLQSGRGDIEESLTIWLLRHSHSVWSQELGEAVLEQLAAHFCRDQATTNLAWELRTALKEFARSMPVSLTEKAGALQASLQDKSGWRQSFEEFLTLLQFRAEMEKAFQVE